MTDMKALRKPILDIAQVRLDGSFSLTDKVPFGLLDWQQQNRRMQWLYRAAR